MPTIYHTILFWLYWLIALLFGAMLATVLFTERDWKSQATAAMLLVPIILRLLLIK